MAERKVYKLCARVSAANAAEVSKELNEISGDGTIDLVIDFEENKFISSAGLRAILTVQKKMNKGGGSAVLINVSDAVKEIFEVTGYSRFLQIE